MLVYPALFLLHHINQGAEFQLVSIGFYLEEITPKDFYYFLFPSFQVLNLVLDEIEKKKSPFGKNKDCLVLF